MATNPLLDAQGLPVPFVGEVIVLMRHGIEFHVDHVPSLGGGKWAARGVLYMSTVRLVFVASHPRPTPSGTPLPAFDLPLLYITREKFNQPIFGANNISGQALPVQAAPGAEASALGPSVQLPHSFVIYFMEGGVGTFLPLFSSLLRGIRAANPAAAAAALASAPPGGSTTHASREESLDPLPAEPPSQVLHSLRSAYVDPKDPTVVYVEQPSAFGSQMRRRKNYQSTVVQD